MGDTARPRWLDLFERELLTGDEQNEFELDLLGIIRTMLEAPEDDQAAADNAAEAMVRRYHESWLPNDRNPRLAENEYLMAVLNSLVNYVFDLVPEMAYPSTEHDRCARVLVRIQELGPDAFCAKDPLFKSWSDALGMTIEEVFNATGFLPGIEGVRDPPTEAANRSRSVSALIAKLLEAGVEVVRLSQMAAFDIGKGLRLVQEPVDPKSFCEFSRRYRAEVASQYILIAGRVLAEQVRDPTEPFVHNPLGREQWKEWAAIFESLVQGFPEDAEWNLKQHMQGGHDRMVELMPELFDGTTQAEGPN